MLVVGKSLAAVQMFISLQKKVEPMYPERPHLSSPPPVRTPEAGTPEPETPEPETPEPEEERPSGGAQGTSAGRGTISAAQGESVLGRERPAQARPVREQRFPCSVPGCGRAFVHSRSLALHMRTHTEGVPLRDAFQAESAAYPPLPERAEFLVVRTETLAERDAYLALQRLTEEIERVSGRPAEIHEVRSGQEVAGTLVAANFIHTLELGIVLGLPSDFLLSLLSDSTAPLRRRLELAMPLNLEAMARVLQEGPQDVVAIANGVRGLAQRFGLTRVESADEAILDELASLLRPLQNRRELLNQALGLVAGRAFLAGVQEAIAIQEDAVHQVSKVTCHAAVTERNSGTWVRDLARAGTPFHTVQEIAASWQARLPDVREDWDGYGFSGRQLERISEDILSAHRACPDAAVPLQEVWPLVRRYVHLPFFVPALGDESAGLLSCNLVAPQKRGVVALLNQAAATAGGGLSWAALMRLARCRMIEPVFIRQLPAGAQGVETVSRAVQTSDLIALVAGSPDGAAEAMEIAALLGTGLKYGDLQRPGGVALWTSGQRTALCIWGYISSRVGSLETGHLAQLLRALGRRDLQQRLIGDADSDITPATPLAEACPRAEQFIQLARDIRREPVAMLKFIAAQNLTQHAGYCAPQGTALAVRLLNILALDSAVLEQFEGVIAASCTASATSPGEMETSNSGLPCDYACPITLDYMEAPVPTLGQKGRVIYFEKVSLLQTLELQPFHPVTKEPLSPDDVRGLDVDRAHLRRIHQWRQAHPELEPDGVPFVPPDL